MNINNLNLQSTVSSVAQRSAASQLEVTQPSSQKTNGLTTSPNQKVDSIASEKLQQQVGQVNEQLAKLGQGISFSIDDSTKTSVVKLIDKDTKEVIKQFPSEQSLKIMQNIQDFLGSAQQSNVAGKGSLTGALFSEII